MILTGRALLYAIAADSNYYSAFWYAFATSVSGVQEIVSRSSVVTMDDWLRENFFDVEVTVAIRNKQIILWTGASTANRNPPSSLPSNILPHFVHGWLVLTTFPPNHAPSGHMRVAVFGALRCGRSRSDP